MSALVGLSLVLVNLYSMMKVGFLSFALGPVEHLSLIPL